MSAAAGGGRRYWRDLLGHFAKRRDAGDPCPHDCCQNHAQGRRGPRSMSEDDIGAHLNAALARDDQRTAKRYERELDRRDRADAAKARRGERARDVEGEWQDIRHAQYLAAEDATNGYLWSKDAGRRGMDQRADGWLWEVNEATARRWASEDLTRYWDQHGRLSKAEWNRQRRASAREERESAREARNPYAGMYPN